MLEIQISGYGYDTNPQNKIILLIMLQSQSIGTQNWHYVQICGKSVGVAASRSYTSSNRTARCDGRSNLSRLQLLASKPIWFLYSVTVKLIFHYKQAWSDTVLARRCDGISLTKAVPVRIPDENKQSLVTENTDL